MSLFEAERVKRFIEENYHFQIYHVLPHQFGFLLETNCGPKHVMLWKSKQEIDWAFLWREHLAQHETLYLDRFIRSKSGAAFHQFEPFFLSVQDSFDRIITQDGGLDWRTIGILIGKLYRNLRKLDQQIRNDSTIHMMKSEKGAIFELEQLQRLKKCLVIEQHNPFTELVRRQFKEIELRWKRSIELSRVGTPVFLAPKKLEYGQFFIRHRLCGFYQKEPKVGICFEGAIAMLKKGYIEQTVTWRELLHFLQGYEEAFQMTEIDGYRWLAQCIYPESFIIIIQAYLEKTYTIEECCEAWLEECTKQEGRDRLLEDLIQYVDQKRGEAVSL